MINRKNEVELEAFKRIKDAEAEATALNQKAEAEATAAIKMAEARRTEAHASADAEKLQAEAARAAAAAPGLAEAEIITAKAEAARLEAEAIRARGLAEAEGQRAMADALAANEGVAQQLELEKLRVSAQIEIGVAQAKAMGEAMASMDFKLYGTPESAQQILRLISLTDGIGSLLQAAPAPLKDLGGRLVDRLLPANGNGGHRAGLGNGDGVVKVLDMSAIQPLLLEASAIATALLNEEERGKLSVREAIERATTIASPEQRITLYQLQGILALVPSIAEQKVAALLSADAGLD
jgi:hypothetical protein